MPKLRPAFPGPVRVAIARSVPRDPSCRSPRRVDGFGQMGITAARLDLLLLGLDINTVEARSIETKNLDLRLHRQNRTGLLGDIGGNFECHELVDKPLRRPDGV